MTWLPSGLRGRLVITFLLVAVTASAVVTGLGYQIVRRGLLDRAERGAVADVRETLSRTTLPIGVSDVVWPSDTTVTEDDLGQVVHALEAPERTVIVTYGRLLRTSPGFEFTIADVPRRLREQAAGRLVHQRVLLRRRPWLIVATQIQRETGQGVVRPTGLTAYVFVPLSEEDAVLSRLRTALAQAGGITLVLALTLALLSARRVLLPVRRLGAAARALGSGDLHVRLPVRGRDELAELTATFNETAAALEETVGELRTLESMSRRFVADVSHELRTPLTAMTAVTDMLSEDAENLPDDAGEAVRIVVREIGRLRVLVEHLIEISRLDAGAARLHRETVDVGDALADCLEVRGWADKVKLTVPVGLTFSLDIRRFDVIVANLVGNALNHGAPPVVVTARVRVRPDASRGLEVTVRDHGKGIPEHALPHVFERFYKAGADRARSVGSGLGLAIARANAELHDGSVTAERREPGILFRLWIPTP
ncbi:sensor histidine kinase [Microbispora triticiradicis]|uniref:histidine kinase n=2 Tax=Microbispora TaxID=2005 RepID=A0ABY3M4B5_9ACTN|nr:MULTISPECIES: HAMP domain-containing sensor histidine kinase [Microbispora]TLP56915.1 HAMP domain-containing histidine kinase [Microbispora fusca]TYB66870.1 HAMP domain-containing histidine kinase [Microbispora tritici]GLW26326.1 two-component sensor histidine kinase [Microbispora amethystogenes]